MDDLALRGARILLTGTFYLAPRRILKHKLKACGAVIPRSFARASQVHGVVYGSMPDQDLLAKAAKRGIRLISEEDMNRRLGFLDDANTRLTQLRALLYDDPPDEALWRRICELLEVWPREDALEQGIEYSAHHAERFPEEVRTGFPRWFLRAATGQQEPRLRLVRVAHIALSGHSHKQHERMFAQLPKELQDVKIYWSGMGGAGLGLLLHQPFAKSLRALGLAGCSLGREGGRRLWEATAQMPKLTSLSVGSCGLPNDTLADLRHRMSERGGCFSSDYERWPQWWTEWR
jgi:hypothetical protein